MGASSLWYASSRFKGTFHAAFTPSSTQREPRLALVQVHVEALINRRFSTPSIEGMLCELLLRRQAALAWARGEGKPGTCDPTKSTFDLCRAIASKACSANCCYGGRRPSHGLGARANQGRATRPRAPLTFAERSHRSAAQGMVAPRRPHGAAS